MVSERVPTLGSLFAGIGGFDLGFERAGFKTIWQVEIDEYCRRVLERHFPDAERFNDVRECGRHNLQSVDVVCGGFPCQPVSVAGRRRAQLDDRWLWPDYARILGELRPAFAVVENVPGLFTAGFGGVVGDLAALGYDAEWQVIPASAVGAPHIRERVWILAYPKRPERWASEPARNDGNRENAGRSQTSSGARTSSSDGGIRQVADAASARRAKGLCRKGRSLRNEARGTEPERLGATISDSVRERLSLTRHAGQTGEGAGGINQGTTSNGDSWWATEPDVGRVAHGIPRRVDRLKGLGNAVVPQIAEWIAERIKPYILGGGATGVEPVERNVK